MRGPVLRVQLCGDDLRTHVVADIVRRVAERQRLRVVQRQGVKQEEASTLNIRPPEDIGEPGPEAIDVHVGEVDCAEHERVSVWIASGRMRLDNGLAGVVAAGLDPLAVRLDLLRRHYREPAELTWDTLREAQSVLERTRGLVARWAESPSAPLPAERIRPALEALDDDLDTERALRVLFDLEHDGETAPGAKFEAAAYLDQVFALDLTREVGRR
ncbi:hypothetical protein D5H75_11600 [Bailinhaonella thermotolerans]|uniref:Uncharacterized protein n=1 Tax=Bailinhaonella thermotolerans TaxID=1070861 RepID=A0A3A4BQL0_9ACTN|nr:hypothetical protein D5H75_11600 [Bailinhaonella thermotolerans]